MESDGFQAALEKSCQEIKRLKMEPGQWADGSNSYGVYRLAMRYSSPEIDRRYPSDDLSLDRTVFVTVAAMPPSVADPYRVTVNFAIDEKGSLEHCVANRADSDPRFVDTACKLAVQDGVVALSDAKGKAVPYVESRNFLFGTGKNEESELVVAPIP